MPASSSQIETALAIADRELPASLERLKALLRIPSISTDPAHAGDCWRAAEHLAAELAAEGFEASVRDTPGHPMVVAHGGPADAVHVLFYGHYDVQPVDPVSQWQTDPFEPVIAEAPGGQQIVARGASDDKGQLMTFLEACRAWRAAGGLPLRVTILLEGEEESGSPSLEGFLDAAAEELRADIALVCDTDMWNEETPSIATMLRGLVGEEVTIAAADKDLHSGMFGGAARNPNQVLAEIIASLRRPDGSVAIEGFYDGVEELPEDVAAQWRGLDFSESEFLGGVGLTVPAGETGRSVLEQIWARPTCEVNGMSGGYTGDGFKTVIPAEASAKISFRLVAGRDPQRIRDLFRAHVEARLPPDCRASFESHGGSPAIALSADSTELRQAAAALSAEWGRETVLGGSGGSIPVVGAFKRRLGLSALLIGFAQIDDRIHSPNEKYNLESFHRGIRSWVRVMAALA